LLRSQRAGLMARSATLSMREVIRAMREAHRREQPARELERCGTAYEFRMMEESLALISRELRIAKKECTRAEGLARQVREGRERLGELDDKLKRSERQIREELEHKQNLFLEDASVSTRGWESEENMRKRVEELKEKMLTGQDMLWVARQEPGSSARPQMHVELGVLGVGTLLWQACGCWEENKTNGNAEVKESKLMDIWGEVWMQAVKEPVLGNRAVMEQRLDWTMKHFRARANGQALGNWNCGKKTDDEVLAVRDEWQHREVARVDCFRQLVVLGWGDWSTTRWMMETKRGANTLERMLRRKERHADSMTAGVLAGMKMAASEGRVGTVRGKDGEIKLYSGDKAETKRMVRERKKQVTGKEWNLKFEASVQTEESVGIIRCGTVRGLGRGLSAAPQPMINTTLAAEMRNEEECRVVEVKHKEPTRMTAVQIVWGEGQPVGTQHEIVQVDQAVQMGHSEGENIMRGMRSQSAGAGASALQEGSSEEAMNNYAHRAAEWAKEAARNPVTVRAVGTGDAVWAVRFEQRTPVMRGGIELLIAIRDAVAGHETFVERKLEEGTVQFDYKEPWPRHFVWTGRGDTVEGKKEWRWAWLRRELRGLVMHESGEVMMRGLPKFFNLGQLIETKMGTLERRKVIEVTEKLDGQMVTGVLVGSTVQYWSRKGLTAVGVTASRVAAEHTGYDMLVREAVGAGSTAVFELVGRQSWIRAHESDEPKLILIAVRELISGEMWGHGRAKELGDRHGVEVVRRMSKLEDMGLKDMVETVRAWKGREGVIVKFEGGVMVKLKSDWWFAAGHGKERTAKATEWRQHENERKIRTEDRCQLRSQRVAVVGWRMGTTHEDISRCLSDAEHVEVVYSKTNGRMRVVIASYKATAEAQAMLSRKVVTWGDKMLQTRAVYSGRTRTSKEYRVIKLR
jgi:hypothetical protein